MKRLALATPIIAVLIGCGGGPAPQDAEAFITEGLEKDAGVNVTSVLCEEADGDRFVCDVEAGGLPSQEMIVEESDL